MANVFEATFRVRLLDASGATLVDRQVMATCGTGCWGSFKVDLDYTVNRASTGRSASTTAPRRTAARERHRVPGLADPER